jgi:uncharacterized protein YecT (DUF1311 family)
MNKYSLLVGSIAVAMTLVAVTWTQGQNSDFKPPGTEEAAAVDQANAEIDKVYKDLTAKLDPQQQKSLKEAQRAWIKWRDAEADLIARVGGAIGGSAMRVDYSNALTKLIKQRTEVLRGYIKEVKSNE